MFTWIGTQISTSSTMYWTLGVIVALQALLVCIGTVAIFVQLTQKYREKILVDRCSRQIQSLLDTLEAQGPEAISEADVPWRKRHRQLLWGTLFEQLSDSKAEEKKKYSQLYERLGFVRRDCRQFNGRNWQQRLKAMRRLFAVEDFYDRHLLAKGLDDHFRIRLLCAHILARRGSLGDTIHALNCLDLTSNLMEQPVYAILRRVDDRRLVQLVDKLGCIESSRVQRVVLVTAGQRQISTIVSTLAELKSCEDIELRIAVCLAAGQLRDGGGTDVLVDALRDPCWQVRACAARVLFTQSWSEALIPLMKAIRGPSFWSAEAGAPPEVEDRAFVDENMLPLKDGSHRFVEQFEVFGEYIADTIAWVPGMARAEEEEEREQEAPVRRAEVLA